MSDQRNLILAIVLSVGIILAFQFFYEMPRMREAQERRRPAGRAGGRGDRRRPRRRRRPGVAVPGRAGGSR